jgi:hypothetical protein
MGIRSMQSERTGTAPPHAAAVPAAALRLPGFGGRPGLWPVGFTVLAATAFLVLRPPVGDLWAARARASAAVHGVGLHYWFSWFGGTVPGHYSVLAPYLSRIADVGVLGAAATVAITPLCHRLVRGSPHAAAATWLAAIGSGFSLWSGRVPFALGTALMLMALLCVRADRRGPAGIVGAFTALLSPVSGAFLILGLIGVFVHLPQRRVTAAWAVTGAGACLLAVAAYFGVPGPEGFQLVPAAAATAAVAVMLLARPAPYVRTVILISLIACPLLAVIPNGMGSNFERFAWICLPVATVATARARLPLIAAAATAAMALGIIGSVHDLVVAAQPMSDKSYYTGLVAQLDRTPGLASYRVEIVPDGTHVAAYALLDHASLARGYETQSDNALNSVLKSKSLDATSYKAWLDNNAVGYVVIDRQTLASGPEDKLVRPGRLPYLRQVWSDAHWRLFKVTAPSPIVAPPGRLVDADQASLVISTPSAGRLAVRVRWSRFLQVNPGRPARLVPDGQGWTTLVVTQPGRYVVTG